MKQVTNARDHHQNAEDEDDTHGVRLALLLLQRLLLILLLTIVRDARDHRDHRGCCWIAHLATRAWGCRLELLGKVVIANNNRNCAVRCGNGLGNCAGLPKMGNAKFLGGHVLRIVDLVSSLAVVRVIVSNQYSRSACSRALRHRLHRQLVQAAEAAVADRRWWRQRQAVRHWPQRQLVQAAVRERQAVCHWPKRQLVQPSQAAASSAAAAARRARQAVRCWPQRQPSQAAAHAAAEATVR